MKKALSIFMCAVMLLMLASCAGGGSAGNSEKTSGNASVSLADDNGGESGENASPKPDESNSTPSQSDADRLTSGKDKNKNNEDILVAYFSCTGNTAQMADYIAEETNGTLFCITPEKSYVAEDIDYNNSDCRSCVEYGNPLARPEISSRVSGFDDYEIIYIGYPIWYGDAPKIIYTFLEQYDFSGKTIIPFCTSSQTDITKSVDNLKKIAPKAKWKKGKRFSPSALQRDIAVWVAKN